ncbi:hypothetical protein MHSWG343_03300 [Candidatus Mycoplasma haematohominis]|uniref:Uncharacterized protein n=1 Tax=Candidatus Mycoplasma haematohominis TaxID=1494318 RepID=A0A478FPL5_9MOLU|nr:hypothetical protein MHSWG343_03300 [Candidatus Mycoplasma haemohominis]
MINSENYPITRKYIFFGFLEKQDRLVRRWLKIELWIIVLLSVAQIAAINHSYSMLAMWVIYPLVTIILAITGTLKNIRFYRLSKKASELISKHKDQYLKDIFNKSPQFLRYIIFLDTLYPISWPISFLFKLAFVRNVYRMNMLMFTTQMI